MTDRITTRAGRKIRHVAPGHVVDGSDPRKKDDVVTAFARVVKRDAK